MKMNPVVHFEMPAGQKRMSVYRARVRLADGTAGPR
jgi:hypothetical protein